MASTSTSAIVKLASRYGFTLVRRKNHLVFANSDGQKLVTSKTASDARALRNIEGTIKTLLRSKA